MRDTAPNAAQAAAWNGPEGAHWAEHGERGADRNGTLHELLFGAAAIAETDRVLDIGCGAGETTLLAALRAPGGQAVGIDLSRPMLDQARADQRRAGLDNVTFEEGDAQTHPFAEGAFDVAISQFGIMFFADPVAAFANIGRALRPGGRLVFVSPQHMTRCEWYTVPLEALRASPLVSTATAARESGMFSLADPLLISDVLGRAGYQRITVADHHVPLGFGRDADEAADFYLGSGPVRSVLEENATLTPAAARTILRQVLERYAGPKGVRIGGSLWLVTAYRPAPDALGQVSDGR